MVVAGVYVFVPIAPQPAGPLWGQSGNRPFSEHLYQKGDRVHRPHELHVHDPSHLRLRSGQQSRRRRQEPGNPVGDSGRPRDSRGPDFLRHGQRPDHEPDRLAGAHVPVQPGDTIVVALLDRFSRNFEEGVRIQAELTGRGIDIVAVRENIDTSDSSAAAKFFRRSMLAQGAY